MEEATEMRSALEKAVSRFRNRTISGAFQRWKQWHDEMRELRATLARGLRFWVQGALARSLERWTVFVEESIEQRRWGPQFFCGELAP